MRDLSNLSVGDLVIVDPGGFGSVERVSRVEKVLSRHLVVGGIRYRKEGGYKTGDGWSRGSIRVGTEQEMATVTQKARRIRMENFLLNFNWRDLSFGALEQAYNITKTDATQASPQP